MTIPRQDLKKMANRLRLDVIDTVYAVKDGHPAPAMSIADLVAVLYFYELKLDPKNPRWADRDRFILSKGHSCPVLYAALARRGYFELSELQHLRMLEGMLQGHPDMNKTPGIDMTSGSLGNGVSIGLGMAMGAKYQKKDFRVYVAVGDGEEEEGIVWEAAMAAAAMKAGNLTVFADCNHYQSGGKVDDISYVYPLVEKWAAFGWHVQEIDGHDPEAIITAIENAKAVKDKPSFVAMRTTKGEGIPYMIGDNTWHKRVPTEEQVKLAYEALGGEAL